MVPNLVYISGLIQKVSQPQQNLITRDIEIGPVTLSIPKSVSMDSFTITFVEEILGSVEYFWRNWFLEMTSGPTLTFHEVKKMCLSFLFTRNATGVGNTNVGPLQMGVEAPVNAYFYPNVLPISYEIDEWDKGGESYVASTITFIRIPNLPNFGQDTTAPAALAAASLGNGTSVF